MNNTINQLDPVDVSKTLYLIAEEYTCFSRVQRTHIKRDHILGNKIRLNKFKMIQVRQSMFSAPSVIKMETNNRKILGKCSNT